MGRHEANPGSGFIHGRCGAGEDRSPRVDPLQTDLEPRRRQVSATSSALEVESAPDSHRKVDPLARTPPALPPGGRGPILEAPPTADPNHHLWRNGRLWWVAFTVHLPGWRKERIRRSLETADLGEARRRRDAIIERIAEADGTRPSLRFAPRREESYLSRTRVEAPLPERDEQAPARASGGS